VADDDHALAVHDDGLPPAKLPQRGHDGIDGVVVVAGVVLVRFDAVDVTQLNLHVNS
jgi:hypothetical protein